MILGAVYPGGAGFMAVLDASFLVKLVVREPSSVEALRVFRGLVREGEDIRVPEIALSEALNAIWKHAVLLEDIGYEEAMRAQKRLRRLWRLIHVYSLEEFLDKVLEIAIKARITVYDSFYIVLALVHEDTLYTFDEKMADKANSLGVKTLIPYPVS